MPAENGSTGFVVSGNVLLDYGKAASGTLLKNLSGGAMWKDVLWTVSDEGRTLECLEFDEGVYRLTEQYAIDNFVADIPGVESADELDLEAVACDDGNLWICGSHCRVRKKPEPGMFLSPELKNRKSRRLLARLKLSPSGRHIVKADWLPFEGPEALRTMLEQDAYLQPFRELPSKESGIDIEGLAARGNHVFLGLRGPTIDNYAVLVELTLLGDFKVGAMNRFFVDLDGLGIRDLAWTGEQMLILAGPMGDASGPFRIHRWEPGKGPSSTILYSWEEISEKPEGLCWLERDGMNGLMVLYDSPTDLRVTKTIYRADWLNFAN
ncbi:DUF3616 domain-containing protein [Rhizobium ruizarguesonis]|uniref:DUF3616 domain-containing protein n=1 Tax=Rhizobium ruizarguesonis TaxID=2081791 RepID=UPI0013DFCA3D|nr:DUF3616 domain-containing protein [Rhizobium ruizarguesonis]NEJ95182.1 DUF3616 domain-containing protein [Rhizobium ruizarguesonis]